MKESQQYQKPVNILLVEDNPGDVRLTVEALRESKVIAAMMVAQDGLEALDVLSQRPPFEHAPCPDLILLDLNLPRMDGREFLSIIKSDEKFKKIPVVILTTSSAEQDIVRAYNLHANCYITKPVDLDQFIQVVKSIDDFWLTIVQLPHIAY
ncbi:MAG: response regulator [Zoogloeaceae bacterium]|jgi:CheY-like chemotaxis protein|nr:response regulator [Zoogloeaceae bacterium]